MKYLMTIFSMRSWTLTSLAAVLSLVGFGCSSAEIAQELSPTAHYKNELKVEVESQKIDGVGVLDKPASGLYNFTFKTDYDTYLFILRSCHREIVLYNQGKQFKVVYAQTAGIEDIGACGLELMALSETGKHAFGFVDFNNEKLSGATKCNGKILATSGVSACHSRAGLIQEIIFMDEVEAGKTDCIDVKPYTGYERQVSAFRYKMPSGKCVIAFKNKKTGTFHRHTAVGYDDIILRIK